MNGSGLVGPPQKILTCPNPIQFATGSSALARSFIFFSAKEPSGSKAEVRDLFLQDKNVLAQTKAESHMLPERNA